MCRMKERKKAAWIQRKEYAFSIFEKVVKQGSVCFFLYNIGLF